MTIFLNIALLLISTTATLAAFGGKTWREGMAPLIERITPRGWLSLFCLVMALAIGVAKEVWSQKQEVLNGAVAAAQLAQTQFKLDLARKDLEILQQRAALTEDRLNDANNS